MEFVETFNQEIASLPAAFFNTFEFTSTGNNLTHPLTLGAIAHVVARFPAVAHVGIDVRLNDGEGAKFQPDIVGFDENFNALVVVDYKSPNSSDARVPLKDWRPFARWRASAGAKIPYFVITTLPEHASPKWELRWTGNRQYNYGFRGQRDRIRSNPFGFWYNHYNRLAGEYDLDCVHMVNINDGHARLVQLGGI